MDVEQILEQFGEPHQLPEEAILAARDQRAELVPRFIEEIEKVLATDLEALPVNSAILIIFHLLGEWRETSAYRPLARLLQADPEKVEHVLGDAITENGHRVMAGVFDGDPQPLYEIILDPEADGFVRYHMCLVLGMLVLEGRLEREEVTRFLRDGFMNILPQSEDPVWVGWQFSIALLGLRELRSLVKKAFDRGYVDPSISTYKHFLADLKRLPKSAEDLGVWLGFNLSALEDSIEELSDWAAFMPEEEYDDAPVEDHTWSDLMGDPAEPMVNPFRHVGRNDPCPCGSGKKFKKCCLQRVASGESALAGGPG